MNIIRSPRNEVSSHGSQQTMIALMAPLSSIDASEQEIGKNGDGAEFVGKLCSHPGRGQASIQNAEETDVFHIL